MSSHLTIRRFMIHKHAHIITATEVQEKGSTGIVASVLRFNSVEELLDQFSRRGVSASALETIRQQH